MLTDLRLRLANALVPKQVKSNIAASLLTTGGAGGVPPKRGIKELLQGYNEMPWLRAVVDKVGKSVGTVNWKLFVARTQDSKAIRIAKIQRATFENRQQLIEKNAIEDVDLTEMTDHPLLDLLAGGNSFLTGPSCLALTQKHLDLAGEAFWILERNKVGMPIAYWPIPPEWIRQFPTADNPFYKIRMSIIDHDVPVTEIIPFIDADPAQPYGRGSGIAKTLGDELEIAEYSAKHLKSFFYNNARPDMIISADNLTREDTKALEEKWLEKHRGFFNKFLPHFINRKIDVKLLTQSFESMQIAQIRDHERNTIMQVFGGPPEKWGVLGNSNRSTILSADLFWAKDILLPRMEFLRSVLQERLVPLFDERLILDFESPIAEDKDFTLATMRAAPWAFRRNEWRTLVGDQPLPPEQGGMEFMQPVNMVSLDENGNPKEFASPLPESEPELIPEDEEDEEQELITELSKEGIKDNIREAIRQKLSNKINERASELFLS